MSRALFAITDDLRALSDLLLEQEELTPEAEAATDLWLADMVRERGEKADAYFWLIRQWEGEEAVAKEEAERCLKYAKTRSNRRAYLLSKLKAAMEVTGETKIITPRQRTFAIQKNGGKQAIEVDPVSVESVNPLLLQTVVQIDRDAVRAYLEAGHTLPFARLVPRGTHLVIK